MNRFMIIFILMLFYSPAIYALEFEFVNSIKKSDITVEDLSSFLDINYYKYNLLIEAGTNVSVVFRDRKNERNVFSHNIKVEKSGEYVIRLWFKKYDNSLGDAFTENNTSINYSLNWNQERAFSGTIKNPVSTYEHVYTAGNTFDYGKEIGKKALLLEFYSYDQKSDKDELVSEIYITTQKED